MMNTFWEWFIELNRFSAIAGSLYFFFFKKGNIYATTVFLILLSSLLADNINYFFIRLVYPNSYYVSNIWQVINFFLVAVLFYKVVNNRLIVKSLVLIYALIAAVSFVSFYGLDESNTLIRVYGHLSIIIFSLLVYIELLRRPSYKLRRLPIFWVSTAFFLYSSVVLLVNLFDNYLVFDLKIEAEDYAIISIMNLAANIAKNFILFYALVLLDKGYTPTLTLPRNE